MIVAERRDVMALSSVPDATCGSLREHLVARWGTNVAMTQTDK
jgi:hypothetical protein